MSDPDGPTRARARALEAWADWLLQRRLVRILERLGSNRATLQLARFKAEMDFAEFVDACRALNR